MSSTIKVEKTCQHCGKNSLHRRQQLNVVPIAVQVQPTNRGQEMQP